MVTKYTIKDVGNKNLSLESFINEKWWMIKTSKLKLPNNIGC